VANAIEHRHDGWNLKYTRPRLRFTSGREWEARVTVTATHPDYPFLAWTFHAAGRGYSVMVAGEELDDAVDRAVKTRIHDYLCKQDEHDHCLP
jgi:hypothetical protein